MQSDWSPCNRFLRCTKMDVTCVSFVAWKYHRLTLPVTKLCRRDLLSIVQPGHLHVIKVLSNYIICDLTLYSHCQLCMRFFFCCCCCVRHFFQCLGGTGLLVCKQVYRRKRRREDLIHPVVSSGALECIEYTFMAITLSSIVTRSGNTY